LSSTARCLLALPQPRLLVRQVPNRAILNGGVRVPAIKLVKAISVKGPPAVWAIRVVHQGIQQASPVEGVGAPGKRMGLATLLPVGNILQADGALLPRCPCQRQQSISRHRLLSCIVRPYLRATRSVLIFGSSLAYGVVTVDSSAIVSSALVAADAIAQQS
jgi:hypothetical protein